MNSQKQFLSCKFFSFSGYSLKYIALVSMTIDHIGAVLLSYGTPLYTAFRGIGRIAFPLYCLLLVEGYLHTSNKKAYFTRLLIFAFLSEIPFDMALFQFPYVTSASVLMSHQNIFFTLAFAFLAMHMLDYYWYRNQMTGFAWLAVLGILAEFLHFDYGLTGVLVVIILFLCKKFRPETNPWFMAVLTVLPLFSPGSVSGICVALAVPFMVCYNGRKGSPLPNGGSFPGAKHLFYIYYPFPERFICWINSLFETTTSSSCSGSL